MNTINFEEIAFLSVQNYRHSLEAEGKTYLETSYVSIEEDGNLSFSLTPHVLKNASKCLLIHSRREFAYQKYYTWYSVYYINEEGVVSKGFLENDFILSSDYNKGYNDQCIYLYYPGVNNYRGLYRVGTPFEKNLQRLWNYYCRVKDVKNVAEMKLIADIFEKDAMILEKEKEIENFKYENYLLKLEKNQYISILEEVKQLLNSSKE